MEFKYAILILDNLRLVKFMTKDATKNMVSDLVQQKRIFQVLKNHDGIWVFVENYIL